MTWLPFKSRMRLTTPSRSASVTSATCTRGTHMHIVQYMQQDGQVCNNICSSAAHPASPPPHIHIWSIASAAGSTLSVNKGKAATCQKSRHVRDCFGQQGAAARPAPARAW